MEPNALCTWVHCNNCVRGIEDRKLAFHFTNCGHIYCQRCVQKNTSEKCSVCGVPGVRTMVLSSNLPPNVVNMFTNALKLPQKVYRAMEFQENQIKRTLHIFRGKADRATKKVRQLMESVKSLKDQNHQLSIETRNTETRMIQCQDRMKHRSPSALNYQGPSRNLPSLQYGTHSDQRALPLIPTRSETPGFQGMAVNAFDPKTPDAFKTGKALLANAVNLQVNQQQASPHVRNLFSPQAQVSTPQQEHRRLSSGSSGGRASTGLGLIARSPQIVQRGFSN